MHQLNVNVVDIINAVKEIVTFISVNNVVDGITYVSIGSKLGAYFLFFWVKIETFIYSEKQI